MNAITINDISKSYAGKKVLENVSLSIPQGQVVALLGRNGVGKTTLMRLLYGLITPGNGSCDILGFDPQKAPVGLRLRTGFMTEECHLYPWMIGRDLVKFLSPMFPTWDASLFQSLIHTLEVPLDKGIGTLSKGSRRKLMMALTLAPKPEVILLDEPLAGLDAVVREQILGTIIHALSEQGCTILLSSHELQEVERISDRVTILSQGRILLDIGRDALKAGIRRVVVTLEKPMDVVPAHPSILFSRCRGAQLEMVVKDYSEEHVQQLLSNFRVRDSKVEGLSLQEIFISLTAGKEE